MRAVTRYRRMFPRRVIARAWCALVALSVLFGVMQAGTRYFYCEALGLSATDPCAHAAQREAPCPLASLDEARFDCCQVITMPSMPEGARAIEPCVSPAGIVALLPAHFGVDAAPSIPGTHVALEGERWRGPPRASRERRAHLMVFLT